MKHPSIYHLYRSSIRVTAKAGANPIWLQPRGGVHPIYLKASHGTFFNDCRICHKYINTPAIYFSSMRTNCHLWGKKKLNCSQSSGTFIGALYACKIFFLFFSSITVQKIKAISWWFMVLINSARYQDIPSHRHQHDEVYSPGSSFIESERRSSNVADNSGEKKMYCRFKKSIKKTTTQSPTIFPECIISTISCY